MKLVVCVFIFLGILSATESAKRSRRLLQNPSVHSSTCEAPLWNYYTGDNWPLAGVLETTKPKFVLRIKGLDSEGRYRPGRKHTVSVRMTKHNKKSKKPIKITGFYVMLERVGSILEECGGQGVFKTSKAKSLKTASPPSGCNQPLILDIGKRQVKFGTGKWVAPTCGDVIMRTYIRGSDRRIYNDADGLDERYQTLTKRLSPSLH